MIELIYSLNTHIEDTFVWLSDTEVLYCTALTDKRKKEFCTARALLRHHLATVHQIPAEEVLINLPGERAPGLTISGTDYYISISHSADAVAVALSLDHKIGVDLEQLKPRKNLQALQRNFVVFSQTGDQLKDFYRCWTQSEAYCKFSGRALLEILTKGLPEQEVVFQSTQLTERYIISICYSNKQNPRLVTVQSLLARD